MGLICEKNGIIMAFKCLRTKGVCIQGFYMQLSTGFRLGRGLRWQFKKVELWCNLRRDFGLKIQCILRFPFLTPVIFSSPDFVWYQGASEGDQCPDWEARPNFCCHWWVGFQGEGLGGLEGKEGKWVVWLPFLFLTFSPSSSIFLSPGCQAWWGSEKSI